MVFSHSSSFVNSDIDIGSSHLGYAVVKLIITKDPHFSLRARKDAVRLTAARNELDKSGNRRGVLYNKIALLFFSSSSSMRIYINMFIVH